MSDDARVTKRHLLALLFGGGAWMLGPNGAESAETYTGKAKPHRRPHHAARKHSHAAAPGAESAPPASSNGYGAPSESGGGGGGGMGGGYSDRRLKRNIVRLGVSPSGLPIYAFQYVWGGPRYIGVMAQDLIALRPEAVIVDDRGYYKVNYAAIDVEMREEAAAA